MGLFEFQLQIIQTQIFSFFKFRTNLFWCKECFGLAIRRYGLYSGLGVFQFYKQLLLSLVPHLSFSDSKVKGPQPGGTMKRRCSSLCEEEALHPLEMSCCLFNSPVFGKLMVFRRAFWSISEHLWNGNICLRAALCLCHTQEQDTNPFYLLLYTLGRRQPVC